MNNFIPVWTILYQFEQFYTYLNNFIPIWTISEKLTCMCLIKFRYCLFNLSKWTWSWNGIGFPSSSAAKVADNSSCTSSFGWSLFSLSFTQPCGADTSLFEAEMFEKKSHQIAVGWKVWWDTPPRTAIIIKWTKILTLEITIFGLKMMVKSGLEFFFEIPRAQCKKSAQKGWIGHAG